MLKYMILSFHIFLNTTHSNYINTQEKFWVCILFIYFKIKYYYIIQEKKFGYILFTYFKDKYYSNIDQNF